MSLLLLINTTVYASEELNKPFVSVEAMEAIARNSIINAAQVLNAELAGTHSGQYPKKLLRTFHKIGKKSITPEYLFDKCIYTKENILSLLSSQFTLEDDAVAYKNKKLYGMRSMFKRRVWKLVGLACTDARRHFEQRLKILTVNGKPLNLDRKSIKELSLVMFFPTHIGRPSIKKSVLQSFTLILSTAVLIGTVGSYIGLSTATVILTISVPINSVWSYTTNLVGNLNKNAKLSELIKTDHFNYLDLTPAEMTWLKK